MKGRSFMPAVAAITLVLMMIAGCKDEEAPTAPTPIRGASNPKAFSLTATSVGLTWSASPDESRSEILNPAYRITARDTLGNSSTLTAVKGQTAITFPGLVEGRVYTFTISTLVTSGTRVPDSVSVRWAPAKRREGEGTGTTPIQVFETASSTFPSGLDVYSSTEDGPVTRSMTGSSNSLIDLFVFTESGSQDLLIRSASLSTVIPTPKITLFSTFSSNGDDLNDPQSAPPDAATYSTLEVRISGSPSGATAGRIIYGRTQENNYFRMLVVRNGTSLVFGTSPDRYLTVRISYQSVSGVRYVRPIHQENEAIVGRD